MSIARLFTQTVSVETFLGIKNSRPSYASPVTVACFVNDSRKLVRDQNGAEVVSETTLYAPLAAVGTFAAGSRVTVHGATSTVLCVYRRDSAGPSSAWHTEVTLT